MKQINYKTDLTGPQFDLIKPCLQVGRTSKWPLMAVLNAILYVCGEGIKWRALPKEHFPPWQTVYWYFTKWRNDGTWQAINEALVLRRRQRGGAAALPTVLAIDSQTVKNTATATGYTGTDGGKKTKGRKRMLIVDSQGNLLAVKVFAANRHDGPVAAKWWQQWLSCYELFGDVGLIRADHHFGGAFKSSVERKADIRVEISTVLVDKASQQAMPVHKGRWVVERTIAWESASRRLARDYERLTESAEAFCLISSISRMIRNPICIN
jgi:putative transposase